MSKRKRRVKTAKQKSRSKESARKKVIAALPRQPDDTRVEDIRARLPKHPESRVELTSLKRSIPAGELADGPEPHVHPHKKKGLLASLPQDRPEP